VSTATNTYSYTSTHTATYLTDAILGTLAEAIAQLGLQPTVITRDWALIEAGILAWIKEHSLKCVSVEFADSTGKVITVVDFPVSYTTTGVEGAAFSVSTARISRFLSKFRALPASTRTRLVVDHYGYHTPMPGWSPTHGVHRAGLRATSAGTLASAPGATASLSIYD
jgi:hypothetical protein